MTQQLPDLIQVDGREYVILNWLGDISCIPDNETLGFEAWRMQKLSATHSLN